MSRKEEYKNNNGQYLIDLASNEDINALGGGVLYMVLESGEGKANVTPRSIVTCHCKGSLISGKVFDNLFERGCPEAFSVNDLIEDFQMALCNMHIGNHWEVCIPWQKGYGKRSDADIPGYSTLIFEIQLLGIA